jgi:hypothetical protein
MAAAARRRETTAPWARRARLPGGIIPSPCPLPRGERDGIPSLSLLRRERAG